MSGKAMNGISVVVPQVFVYIKHASCRLYLVHVQTMAAVTQQLQQNLF